jgi:hypothetical protein
VVRGLPGAKGSGGFAVATVWPGAKYVFSTSGVVAGAAGPDGAMSLVVNRAAEARIMPAATDAGTITSILAWVPKESAMAPIRGRSRATPGMPNTDIVEKAVARARGGATSETRARKAGAKVLMLAARSAWSVIATATWGA